MSDACATISRATVARTVGDDGVIVEKPAVAVHRGGDGQKRVFASTVYVSYDTMRCVDKGIGRGVTRRYRVDKCHVTRYTSLDDQDVRGQENR